MERHITNLIVRGLKRAPAVVITGARQVGKTTLAKRIAKLFPHSTYLDLERPSDVTKLIEPELFLNQLRHRLVILDEVQRVPGLFPLLRSLIDEYRRPGRFLLLGSAAPALIGMSAESLAGRVAVFDLTPFTIAEVKSTLQTLANHWLRGGFPKSFLASSNNESLLWREHFIRTLLEQDIPQFGIRVSAANLRRFWLMLAHHQGQIWNASQFASAFGLSPPTMQHYLGILQDMGIVRVLSPFAANLKKRLVKSPRTYIRDSGLLHALLGINSLTDLQGHPVVGSSWEGWAIEQIASLAPARATLSYYRTAMGAEIDLIVEHSRQRLAFEIKYSSAPKPAKGFWVALEDLQPTMAYVIAPVKEAYPIAKKAKVWPAHRLSELFKSSARGIRS